MFYIKKWDFFSEVSKLKLTLEEELFINDKLSLSITDGFEKKNRAKYGEISIDLSLDFVEIFCNN